MNVRNVLIALGVLVVVVAVYWLFFTDPLESVLDQLEEAIEAEDADAILALVADDYKDPYGVTRERIGEFARRMFARFDHINFIVEKTESRIDGARGELRLEYKLVLSYGDFRGYVQGGPNQTDSAVLFFTETDDGWKISSIEGSQYAAHVSGKGPKS